MVITFFNKKIKLLAYSKDYTVQSDLKEKLELHCKVGSMLYLLKGYVKKNHLTQRVYQFLTFRRKSKSIKLKFYYLIER